MTDGVYCLANDGVVDWMVALLASLRTAAPELPVIVIPYDDRISRLSALRHVHPFEFWDDRESLEHLDAVGSAVNLRTRHTFRKIAAFWGPFERFIFLDSDIIVSRGIDEALGALHAPGFLCGDIDMDQVFVPSGLRREIEGSGRTCGFNTGFFASTRDALPRETVLQAAAESDGARPSFVSSAQEQPFLNWCVWASGLPVSPLADAVRDTSTYTGALRRPIRCSSDGEIRVLDASSDDYGRRMLVVHWAGFRCTSQMPNRRLFLRYRLGETSIREQATFLARWSVGSPKAVISRMIASSRDQRLGRC